MSRQHPSGSRFPSMGAFMGENPSKRPRMQEPQRETMLNNMKVPEPEADDDEVWEELDEDAMEECMILATQMCSDQVNNTEKKSSTSAVSDTPQTVNGKVIQRNDSRSDVRNNRSSFVDQFGDSGFSSTRGTALDSSRVFPNAVKSKVINQKMNTPVKTNPYANRFSDFSTTSNSQTLPTPSRSHQNPNRVYNSIPIKGNNSANAIGGSAVSYPSTSKDSGSAKFHNSANSKDSDTAKLKEEILLMQGEISMLRSELKRKETALTAERLERCSLIDSAEKKGREKAMAASKEAEKKVMDCNKTIEKLQDDLHFKKHEIEELQAQFQNLEKKMQQQSVSPSQKTDRLREVSPRKPGPSFKDRFDFGNKNSNRMKDIEVQTETSGNERKDRRPHLNVKFPRGRGHINRQIASALSSEGSKKCEETLSKCNRWSIDSEWRNALGKIALDDGDVDSGDDLQRQLLVFSIQRLEEAFTIFAPERAEILKSKDSKPCEVTEVYDSHVIPSLSVMKCLTTTKCSDLSEKAFRAVCCHLPHFHTQDKAVINCLWPFVMQALGQLSRITEQIEEAVSLLMIEKLKTLCDENCSGSNLLLLLHLLQDLAHHMHFTNNLCRNEGDCFISKLCSAINQHQEDHLSIATYLLDWLSAIIGKSPVWLSSECSCPVKLLAALLKEIQYSLDHMQTAKGLPLEDFRKLLIPAVRLFHVWSLKDSSWWEKIAHLPHYTVIMGAIANNAKAFSGNRQTVGLAPTGSKGKGTRRCLLSKRPSFQC